MTEWIIIAVLILFGFGLIIIEILFVPGTTIVGIFGLLMSGFGVYYTYDNFGNTTGSLVLIGSVVVFLILLYISFKRGTWKKFTLKNEITSRFNEDLTKNFKIGDVGKAISTIKPIGNADFEGKFIEVISRDEYIEPGEMVEIIEKKGSQVIVKLKV
jgi:membrane-bound ClpP family serine protease